MSHSKQERIEISEADLSTMKGWDGEIPLELSELVNRSTLTEIVQNKKSKKEMSVEDLRAKVWFLSTMAGTLTLIFALPLSDVSFEAGATAAIVAVIFFLVALVTFDVNNGPDDHLLI